MTLTELFTILKSISGYGNKVTYRAWPVGNAPGLPYICYYVDGSDNIKADDKVLLKRQNVSVELYTSEKDVTQETLIENALDVNHIIWEKTETYLDTENCYQIAYDFVI